MRLYVSGSFDKRGDKLFNADTFGAVIDKHKRKIAPTSDKTLAITQYPNNHVNQ